MLATKDFFTKAQQQEIISAIKRAELDTSGEVRLHVENECKGDVLDRASGIFAKLKMHKTKLRNGVLFYVAIHNRKFAILGDAGINAKVPEGFWDEIKLVILDKFKQGLYVEGLVNGIIMAGEKLKEHFPYNKGDINELSDDISFSKD